MFESPKNFFSQAQKERLVAAIQKAECDTSGEIRLHLEKHLGKNSIEAAKKIFEKIGMTATRERNGVLIVLAIQDHQLVILGDEGIDRKVPNAFWEQVKDQIIFEFKKNQFVEGLELGIRLCGEKLKEFFPYQRDDSNELSDHISLSQR